MSLLQTFPLFQNKLRAVIALNTVIQSLELWMGHNMKLIINLGEEQANYFFFLWVCACCQDLHFRNNKCQSCILQTWVIKLHICAPCLILRGICGSCWCSVSLTLHTNILTLLCNLHYIAVNFHILQRPEMQRYFYCQWFWLKKKKQPCW